MNKDYIKWIRSIVGHERIILNFAGGCIFNENGEVLLQKRRDVSNWGFPGGAIELGESAERAAIREIKEETGLDVKAEKLIGIYSDYFAEYPNGDKAQSICTFFEFSVTGGKLFCDKKESIELKYFSLDDLPELFCKQHKDISDDIINKRYGVFR